MRIRTLVCFAVLVAVAACVEQMPDTPSEADLQAAKAHILKEPPATLKHAVNAELEGKLVYLGCDVDAETLKPGQSFTLKHYWKVIQPVGDDWKLFVHMNGQGGKQPFVNLDHRPVTGKYPVAYWKAGEIIRDIHRVTLPLTWKSPRAEIYTGIWKGQLRLKVTKGKQDGQNRVLALSLPVQAAAGPKLARYLARKVDAKAIKVDGKLDEEAWKTAPSTGLFVNTMTGAKAPEATEAKLLWDEEHLYVGFDVKDTDVWSTFKKRDDKLWQQEAVELFVDWSKSGKNYIEIQVNPNGAVFDSFLPTYRKHWKAKTEYDYDSGVVAKVTVDGTLDNRGDKDKGWVVELALPLKKVQGPAVKGPTLPPKPGDSWRINLFRVDRPKGAAERGSAWSPPLKPDYHTLARFGLLVFADEKGQAPPPVGQVGAKVPGAKGAVDLSAAKGAGAKAITLKKGGKLVLPQAKGIHVTKGIVEPPGGKPKRIKVKAKAAAKVPADTKK